ncbi:MAG: Gfo/Idh/MocA family oxidoreductase [Candidatus Omnitrophica bacterium]|nr:Gfo/Idh/MocA family oxidoreductase [Candidatus Omnitrophota bacterium]
MNNELRSPENILVMGYGSIGKRHVGNLLTLGYHPMVLTRHPDNNPRVKFLSDPDQIVDVSHAVICSPTASHAQDIDILSARGIKNFLVEKPIEKDLSSAEQICTMAKDLSLRISVAYNMRFFRCFDVARDFIQENKNDIRLVRMGGGQYLPDWRPQQDYRQSYSSHKDQGGGVALDLSHEIDYMLWLFGLPVKWRVLKSKISRLEIDSDDIFSSAYLYPSFMVEIELDYIRRRRMRFLSVICESGKSLYCDFINKNILIESLDADPIILEDEVLFDVQQVYLDEMKEFLSVSPVTNPKLAALSEAITVMKLLEEQ